jgi:hypothetical protein
MLKDSVRQYMKQPVVRDSVHYRYTSYRQELLRVIIVTCRL